MKKNLMKIGPFLIVAALVYAAGWYLPTLTATVNQNALKSSLGLPNISVTQESWDQMDLSDQWSSETWTVTQLPDGSGFAARPAAGWFTDYKMANLHKPFGAENWEFVGYDVDITTLASTSPSIVGLLVHNIYGIVASLIVVGCAGYVLYKRSEKSEKLMVTPEELASRQKKSEESVEELREEVSDAESMVSETEDLLTGQDLSSDEAHALREKADEVKDALAQNQKDLSRVIKNSPASNEAVDLGEVVIGTELGNEETR